MTTSFEQLLKLLTDETEPFPIEGLGELSDMDAERTTQFSKVWDLLPTDRRRTLIHEVGTQADLRIELTFEQVNRLALSDPDSEVRAIAIHNLWECENPDLVPHFLETLKQDPITQVRAAAAKALGLFIWLGEIDQLNGDLLHQIEETLLEVTKEDHEDIVRRRGLESLGFSSNKEVPPLIEEAYQSGDEAYIQSALFAMGRSASDQWGSYVMVEMNNPSPSIRKEAAKAAGELELQQATESLIELLDDVSFQVRDSAIWALGQLGGEEAADALLMLLDNTEDETLVENLEEALDHLAGQGALALVYALTPRIEWMVVSLALAGAMLYAYPGWALLGAVWSIPLFYAAEPIGPLYVPPSETLLYLAAVIAVLRLVRAEVGPRSSRPRRWAALDLAWALWLAWGTVSAVGAPEMGSGSGRAWGISVRSATSGGGNARTVSASAFARSLNR